VSEGFTRSQTGNRYPKKATPEQMNAFWKRQWEAALPLARENPVMQSMAANALRAVINDRSSTTEQIGDAIAVFRKAAK